LGKPSAYSLAPSETREQNYLETLIAREDYAKEVQLYQLGPMLLERYRSIFNRLTAKTALTCGGEWGYLLGLLSTAAFTSPTLDCVRNHRADFPRGHDNVPDGVQAGQTTFFSPQLNWGMYEDNLYLSNLYEFLEQNIPKPRGHATKGPVPGDGIRFLNVSFKYPGSLQPALKQVSLHLKPGKKLAIVGENGSGKPP